LLLNCYAKLKDIDKLEKFIKSPGDLKFDLDTAIAMCRQGGYYEQAAYLARKHGETDLVVDILIEDAKKYPEALDFIWSQDPDLVRHTFPFDTDIFPLLTANSRPFPACRNTQEF
jgi:vacuolar protein sorting-associated protein 11